MTANIRFVWNPKKSEANRRKHGIDFEFARRVFFDPLKRIEPEGDDHGEVRWRTIGEIERRVFVVSHTIREEGETEVIRIITARKAGRGERQEYEGASRPHR
jgi:uncharacterized DUF497 family protein